MAVKECKKWVVETIESPTGNKFRRRYCAEWA
jgi:hypothetical protein